MSIVLDALARHAQERPSAVALAGGGLTLGYGELHAAVTRAAGYLRERGTRVLALALDNGPAWVTWDLAAQQAGVAVVPIPPFFTVDQTQHTLADAGADALVAPGSDTTLPVPGCRWDALGGNADRVPAGTAKITYTSGTTGRPKGVCLAQSAIDAVIASLADATAASADDRHLALLPLAVLLENVGVNVPLLVGGTALVESLAQVGMSGSSGLDAGRMLACLDAAGATAAITVPALLDGLVRALEAGAAAPARLRYLAVGGATVAPRLLERARAHGLPVYQGYGLSECASVVAVNRPGDDDPATVGRPLRHTELAIADDGEIRVRCDGFLGYLGDAQPPADGWWPTGDLGRLDGAGRLHIRGRRKNLFITAFGRNVAPEWVESELTAEPALRQAAVFGEARPWNAAVLVTAAADGEVVAALARANRRLPDYAQVRAWVRATAPFTPGNGQATANGRVRRDAVLAAYGPQLDALYEKDETKEVTHEFL